MDAASLNRRARERLLSHCPTEVDLRAFLLDYLPQQLPHIPDQGSLQEKISRLIERVGAEALLAALAQAAGEAPEAAATLADAQHVGRPTGVFVGRREELDWLRARLADPAVELRPVAVCALQGMAGVGKSYLCDQFFEENRAAFPGGYCLLSLSPGRGTTTESLIVELAAQLRIEVPIAMQAQVVVARLRQPRTLLHIENVDDEALAEAVVGLARKLAGCAVLVSARQRDVGLSPRLRWQRLELPPLPEAEAFELLSREFRPARTPKETDQYRTIVEQLGALPLAVHLAAGRLTQGLRLDSLLADLQSLVLDRRSADPGEHGWQILRASILASLRALEQAVRADADPELPIDHVAPALSGLAAGPSAGVSESLAYALLGLRESAGEKLLVRARGFSLVERVDSPDGVRWRMHPLVAATVSRTTTPLAAGGLAGMRAWFLARLPVLSGEEAAQQGQNWEAIRRDEPALLHWLAQVPAAEAGSVARIGSWHAFACGPYGAWAQLCQRGLAASPEDEDRSWLLLTLCESLQHLGQLTEALATAEQLSQLERSRGNESRLALSLGMVADIYQARGQLDEALRIRREEELPVYGKLGDIRLRAVTMGQIADIYEARGQLDEALRIYQENIPIREKLGDVRGRAVTMGKIADILAARGQLDEALRIRREEELPVYGKLGDLRSRAVTQRKIADILEQRGQLEEALRLIRDEALPAVQRIGAIADIAVFQGRIADIYQARGQLDEALRIRREEALPVFEKLGDIRSRAVTMGQIADIYQARGQLDEALRIRREEELPVYEKLGDIRERAVTMGQIADIYQARGQLDEALRIHREEELPVYGKLGDIRERALTMGKIADILAAQGKLDEAIAIYEREVFPAYRQLGDQQLMAIDATNLTRHYLRRGAPGDRERARALLLSVQPQAVAMQLPVAKDIAELLAELDAAVSSPAEAKE
jgi:tetratricopeptide (TPR) repeat protein